jgi:hypothetical protein
MVGICEGYNYALGWKIAAAWYAWVQCITTKHPVFGCVVPVLWGTVEEIRKFGEVLGKIAHNQG